MASEGEGFGRRSFSQTCEPPHPNPLPTGERESQAARNDLQNSGANAPRGRICFVHCCVFPPSREAVGRVGEIASAMSRGGGNRR